MKQSEDPNEEKTVGEETWWSLKIKNGLCFTQQDIRVGSYISSVPKAFTTQNMSVSIMHPLVIAELEGKMALSTS